MSYVVHWNFRRWEFETEGEKDGFVRFWKLKGEAHVFIRGSGPPDWVKQYFKDHPEDLVYTKSVVNFL